MDYRLGLRTLLLLAIVAACTAVLVAPGLVRGEAGAGAPPLLSLHALGHG